MTADSQCDRLSLQRLGLQHLPLLNQPWLEALRPLLLQQLLNQAPQQLKQLLTFCLRLRAEVPKTLLGLHRPELRSAEVSTAPLGCITICTCSAGS